MAGVLSGRLAGVPKRFLELHLQWLASKCLDEGSALIAFSCSIHNFLCNCGYRTERLDRRLTSEGSLRGEDIA